jgi:hypothetical protein
MNEKVILAPSSSGSAPSTALVVKKSRDFGAAKSDAVSFWEWHSSPSEERAQRGSLQNEPSRQF